MSYWVDSRKHPELETGVYFVISSDKKTIWEGIGLDGRDTCYNIARILNYFLDPDEVYEQLDAISKTRNGFYNVDELIKCANELKTKMSNQSFPDIVITAINGILKRLEQ